MSLAKVGFDARMWDHPGIGRYIRELSLELVRQPFEAKFYFLGTAATGKELRAASSAVSFRQTFSGIYSLAEQFEIPAKASDLDLLHVPHFNIPGYLNKKLVVTVHDLIYLHDNSRTLKSVLRRQYVQWLFGLIQKKASAIITVSEHTKKDLIKTFPKISVDKIFVTQEAVSERFRKIEDGAILAETKKTYSLNNPFVLFVGTLKAHKNIPTIIQAIERLKTEKGLQHDLVLVGRPDAQNKSLLDLIARSSFVRYLGELSDEAVIHLYNLADVFVLPSFFEGFGLPALEAMACGCPVIASNRSSLPEVVGDAGLLFEPQDIDGLAELLYNVLENRQLRKKMSQNSLERVKIFSWEKTAKQTLEIYRNVLTGKVS